MYMYIIILINSANMKKMKLNTDTLYTLTHNKHTDIPIIIHIYTYIHTYNMGLFKDFYLGGSESHALACGKPLVGHTHLSLNHTLVTSAIIDWGS